MSLNTDASQISLGQTLTAYSNLDSSTSDYMSTEAGLLTTAAALKRLEAIKGTYTELDSSSSDSDYMDTESRQSSLKSVQQSYASLELDFPEDSPEVEDELELVPVGPSKPWRKAYFMFDESIGPSDPKAVTRIGHARIKEYGKPTYEVHDDILGPPVNIDTPVEERFVQKGVKVVKEFQRVRGEKEIVSVLKTNNKLVKVCRRVVVRDVPAMDDSEKISIKISPKKFATKAMQKILVAMHII